VAGELLFRPYFLRVSLLATIPRSATWSFFYSFYPFHCCPGTLARSYGVRSIVAESLIIKHQLLIVNRSRQRSPNLCTSDRILAGLMAFLVRLTRLLRSAIVLKPSTLLGLHKARSKLSPSWLCFYCAKTLRNRALGAYFEREADSPKLLETLESDDKGGNRWNEGSCLQSRRLASNNSTDSFNY